MLRFEKTALHPVSAVLLLIGLYALAGLAYAAVVHSAHSVAIWTIVAVLAFLASAAYQRYVTKKRSRVRQGRASEAREPEAQ